VAGVLAAGLVTLVLAASAARPPPTFGCATTPRAVVGVAVGYKDADGWTTEGWWNLPSRTCGNRAQGAILVARYYYVYAIDYDHGVGMDGYGRHVAPRQGVHDPRHR